MKDNDSKMPRISQVNTEDGISWYVEQYGSTSSTPHILLIPSGEGDCTVYSKTATALSPQFTVTTFDLPCLSRTIAPFSAIAAETLTPYKIADQIILLMDKLQIPTASIFGSSSGGNIGVAMISKYSERVEKLLIHEVPFQVMDGIQAWVSAPESEDANTVKICQHVFAHEMNEDLAAWEALGEEYHKRLERNFPVWYRNYTPVVEKLVWDREDLRGKRERIFWSVGGLMPMSWFFMNVVFAVSVGIEIESK